MKMKIRFEPEVTEVTSKCSPVSTGSIENGGWVWSYPAIGKVAGTAGNLERWVTGFKVSWQDLNDPAKTEESFSWVSDTESEDSASEWLERF